MEFIAHRVNTVKELREVPAEFGTEIDLRDYGDRLILQHDPFKDGEDFEDYLKEYHHGTLILNIKSERIEHRVLELIKKYKINKYFFLDSSFPMIRLLTESGERNMAVRYSEYEGKDTVIAMAGRADWIWVDTFSRIPLDMQTYTEFRRLGFKLCLVSPELQGQPEKIADYAQQIKSAGYVFDAVCSKIYNAEKWLKYAD